MLSYFLLNDRDVLLDDSYWMKQVLNVKNFVNLVLSWAIDNVCFISSY